MHEGALDELRAVSGDGPLTLVLPAESCVLRQVEFSPPEKKLLHKTIPYSLEDDLVDRVDDMHVALGDLPAGSPDAGKAVLACAVAGDTLERALQPFHDAGIRLTGCLPETLLLPWQADQWTLVLQDQGRCLLRTGYGEGIACHRANLAMTLAVLARHARWPQRLRVIRSGVDDLPDLQGVLATVTGLADVDVETHDEPYWRLLARADSDSLPLNLLSGRFAPRLPWERWWQRWKIAAMLVLAIAAAELATMAAEIHALDALQAASVEATTAIFHQVIPQGVIVDAPLQLQRRLEALRGNGDSGFVALLDKAAPVIMDNPDLSVQNLDYSEREREIQVTLVTRDFNTAESIRARLQSLGLQAELAGSTSAPEGNRSRLIIGDRG